MPRFLFVVVIIQFVFSDLIIVGQVNNDCSAAQVICGSQSQLANNFGASVDVCNGCSDGATSAGNFCYEINNTVWFSFMTNAVGGDVTVSFSNLQCIVANGIGNGLQATVISAGTPCNESTYSAVGNCEPGSVNDFTLLATNLLPNTTYFIQVDGAEGTANAAECSFTIMVSGEGVDVFVNAGENQVISEGQSAELVGTGPSGSVWSPNSSLSSTTNANTIATPEVSSTYTYSYTASNGCVYSDNVSVIIEKPIIVTNTFTPNEDGINDYWEIIDAEKYQAIKITVFDRWGQKVFNTIGYSSEKRWNGTFLNKDVPPGVYFYSIDLNEGNKEEVFTGYVTVIR